MGRLIDANKLKDSIVIIDPRYIPSSDMYRINQLKKWIDEQPTVEAIPKADYETHLKADLTAILEEFDLRLSEYEDADLIRVEYLRQDIQEKIDALKPESEDNINVDSITK